MMMYFHRQDQPAAAPSSAAVPPSSALSLDELEHQHIERVLREHKFNRARTAESLGISKKTLYLKIKRFGLAAGE
jgi:two-component system NtrC family response regulator